MNLKLLVLIVLAVIFLYEQMLELVDRGVRPLPDSVKDVYDAQTYAKWKEYHLALNRLNLWRNTVSFVVNYLVLALDGYAAFAALFGCSEFMQLLAVVLLMSLTDLATLPLSWVETMKIEEKYGFNRSTAKTFWADQMKSFVISFLLMAGIAALLMGLHHALGDWLILAFAGALMVFMLLISFLFPYLSRVFNKFTPLEDGELKTALTALLEKHGYRVHAIQVMDASRRTTKSNAYFTGFGNLKTIVLYDTLIQNMSNEEICAVFAHEMGHGLHRDTLKMRVLSFLGLLMMAVLAWFTVKTPGLFTAFGFAGINYGFALLLIFSVEFALLSPLTGLYTNAFSRRAEYRADTQAVEEGYGDALISALKKLCRVNFSDLSPNPVLVKLTYSHPPLADRLAAIENAMKQEGKKC